jgi:hypothetical protein
MKKLKVNPEHIVVFCEQPRTSRHVSDFFGISLCYAQQLLRALKKQERLDAVTARDESGFKLHTEYVAIETPPAHDPFNLTRRVNHGQDHHTGSYA